ncbi:MAG: hypothetical protein ACRC8B_16770 [Aeromonas sobria]|uniref:hypothetical protein n=1 Tax=Aeromonas sobria TaxID=646 RepID=UPI003F367D0A
MDEYQSESYQQTMMSHARCMVCGTHNQDLLGIRFYQGEEGATEGLFIANECHQGYSDILHGGMTSTLLDAVMMHIPADHEHQFRFNVNTISGPM